MPLGTTTTRNGGTSRELDVDVTFTDKSDFLFYLHVRYRTLLARQTNREQIRTGGSVEAYPWVEPFPGVR